MSIENMDCEGNMRDFIINLEQPVIFHNMIDDWNILSWDLRNWNSLFGNKLLPFRCGINECSPTPQWERFCSTEYLTMDSFISAQEDKSAKQLKKWFYFDYKHINKWACHTGAVDLSLQSISWKKFGFPEIDANGSTLWIGSAGAHTPCHMDTYGCNLVAQIFGKKQWILFPPGDHKTLKASRIPYEESSIYSEWNFSCPLPLSSDFFETVKNVFVLTLSPGDVLFVPHHWWHFVENLTTSVSVNTWIPLEADNVSRVDEALVRCLVAHVSMPLQPELKQHILNPNEDDINSSEALDLLKVSVCQLEKQQNSDKNQTKEQTVASLKRRKVSPSCSKSQVLLKNNVIERLSQTPVENLKALLDAKCTCDSQADHEKKMKMERVLKQSSQSPQSPQETLTFLSSVVNAFCQPDIIKNVRRQLTDSNVKI